MNRITVGVVAWPKGPDLASALMCQVGELHRDAVLRMVAHRFRGSTHVTREWVEDAVQSAATKLWCQDEVVADLRALWVTAAINCVRDVLKSADQQRRVDTGTSVAGASDPERLTGAEREVFACMTRQAQERFVADTPLGRLIQGEFREDVEAFLTELDPVTRRLFRLVDIEGQDYDEASRRVGLTRGASKMRVSRARAALRDWLDVMRPDILTTELGG